jgi:hypothetical protein
MSEQGHGVEQRGDSGGLTRWELNWFLATSVLAGAFLMALVSAAIPRVLAPLLELPRPVWFGLGFLVLGWTIYPALQVSGRLARPPWVVPWKRFLVGSLIGSLVGTLVYALVYAALETWL